MKSNDEKKLAKMQDGGRLLAAIRQTLLSEVKVGKTGLDIDRLAERLIRQAGGKPSFQQVPGYHWSTCICTNDIIVHGIPSDKPFAATDVVGIDVGMFYQGFHTDAAWTVRVGSEGLAAGGQGEHTDIFLKTGENALNLAIKQARLGNRVGHISLAIQKTIEGAGFSIVKSLVGHGVGRKLHEEPEIPGFLRSNINMTQKLIAGMTIAIEVIYAFGRPEIQLDRDRWTVRTKDHSLAGLFEETVMVTEEDPGVLTRL